MSNRLDFLRLASEEYKSLDTECDAAKAEYDKAHAHVNLLYKEWQQEHDRYFCVYCFKPMFLDVLVERLKGIAESIIADISRRRNDVRCSATSHGWSVHCNCSAGQRKRLQRLLTAISHRTGFPKIPKHRNRQK